MLRLLSRNFKNFDTFNRWCDKHIITDSQLIVMFTDDLERRSIPPWVVRTPRFLKRWRQDHARRARRRKMHS